MNHSPSGSRDLRTMRISQLKSRKRKPIIGLALGSGAARGLAHIGVIRAIEEAGITIDVIAGTSIGALVGAVYASGTINSLERDFRRFDWKTIGSYFDPGVPRSGLLKGKKIVEFVRSHLSARTFDDLPIPLCAIATDVRNGDEVVLGSGDLMEAIRASISIPGIMTPVQIDSRILVDGGLVNPVPVSAARALGADIVIAVDLNFNLVAGRVSERKSLSADVGGTNYARASARIREGLRSSKNPAIKRLRTWIEKEQLPSVFEVLLSSLHIMEVRITESRLYLERPEVLLRPPLSSVHLLEFDRADDVIDIGYRTAIEPMRELARSLHA
jgi:NTE family protein